MHPLGSKLRPQNACTRALIGGGYQGISCCDASLGKQAADQSLKKGPVPFLSPKRCKAALLVRLSPLFYDQYGERPLDKRNRTRPKSMAAVTSLPNSGKAMAHRRATKVTWCHSMIQDGGFHVSLGRLAPPAPQPFGGQCSAPPSLSASCLICNNTTARISDRRR